MKEVFQKVLYFLRDHLVSLLYMIFHHVGKARRQELERKLNYMSDKEESDKSKIPEDSISGKEGEHDS